MNAKYDSILSRANNLYSSLETFKFKVEALRMASYSFNRALEIAWYAHVGTCTQEGSNYTTKWEELDD